MPVKVVIITQNDLSSTALPEPYEVAWSDFSVNSFMKFHKAQNVINSDTEESDYLLYHSSTIVSKVTGTVAVLIDSNFNTRKLPKHYRPLVCGSWAGRPCSITRDDALWMVGCTDLSNDGGGVYAWAYNEEDATHIARVLNQYPERFEEVGISSFIKNVNDPAGPIFPADTFTRQQDGYEWCIKGIPANTTEEVILTYAKNFAEAQKLWAIFDAYPEFYSLVFCKEI